MFPSLRPCVRFPSSLPPCFTRALGFSSSLPSLFARARFSSSLPSLAPTTRVRKRKSSLSHTTQMMDMRSFFPYKKLRLFLRADPFFRTAGEIKPGRGFFALVGYVLLFFARMLSTAGFSPPPPPPFPSKEGPMRLRLLEKQN